MPDRTGSSLYCPQDCQLLGPVCGDAICTPGEADEYRLGENGPVLIRRGVCPEDCEGGLNACEQKKKSVDVLFAKNVACETSDDCTVFTRGCSPYQTCGTPVLKSALMQVSAAVYGYVDDCEGQEPALCAGCLPNRAECINNVCAVVEDL